MTIIDASDCAYRLHGYTLVSVSLPNGDNLLVSKSDLEAWFRAIVRPPVNILPIETEFSCYHCGEAMERNQLNEDGKCQDCAEATIPKNGGYYTVGHYGVESHGDC